MLDKQFFLETPLKKLCHLIKKNKVVWDTLVELTPFIENNQHETLRERIFCLKYNIIEQPKCLMCEKPVKFQKDGPTANQYNKYCSKQCSQKDTQNLKHRIESFCKQHNVNNPFQILEIKQKIKQTILEKYGVENPLQNPLIKQKQIQTNLEKYGVENPLQNPLIKQKQIQTNLEKYGRKHFNQSFSQETIEKLNDKNWLLNCHVKDKKSLLEIAKELGVCDTTVGRYLHKHGIDTRHFGGSQHEKQLIQWLQQQSLTLITNDRSLISPYELDIFIPSHKIAIELCGLYWHSDVHKRITKNYHYQKYKMCKDKGIRLITIFEDEWVKKQDIVKNKLLLLFNKNKNIKRLNARNCTIKLIDTETKKRFFQTYHIQGNGPSSVNLGLFHENELVSCMGLIRTQKDNYIINRFASSCLVRGGFTKLLSYFKNNYCWNKIITFADLRWSEGMLYQQAGFVCDKILPADYQYTIPNKMIRIHKFNFRHKFLRRLLKEQYDPTLTEKENVEKIPNIFRIYDCGKKRFVINK